MKPRIVIEIADGVIQAVYGDLIELDVRVFEEYPALDTSMSEEVEYSYDTKQVEEVFDDENTDS